MGTTSGSSYYDHNGKGDLPWVQQEIQDFIASQGVEGSFEKELETNKGKRYYHIKLKKMLDVSGKYGGTVVIFDDLTERRKMERKLALMATTDSLTGIYNRGWYLTLSEKEILRSRRYHLPMSLIMADIDHFKHINDRFGHHIGDQVLREVSGLLQKQLRAVDIMGRIGGEEFGITLIESDLKRAATIADRLRDQIEQYAIQTGSVEIRCTGSFGVTQLDGKSEDIHSIMKRADEALYRAKRNGRNCIHVLS
jgi:diguanylate cyclase (GGDEF)-like protein